jgi:glucose-1-phosphate thymidylyltransferase
VKGVVLAGGLGTRLYPLTKITNKHLLPVYNKPMIYYPIQTLIDAGIKDILIVTGGNNAGDFLRLLGTGEEFGLKKLNFTYQRGERGIADALRLAEGFYGNDKIVVILGDNIIGGSIRKIVEEFEKQEKGARIVLKEVDNPCDYGVAEIKNNKIVRIIEKPKHPPSNLAVIGVYMYDSSVFEIIKKLKPSKRNEYEITDVNNEYLRRGCLEYSILKSWWIDAGASIDKLLEANIIISKLYKKSSTKSTL